ncbi:MAG: DUF1501 domain-containing protein, partial [Verrucomicrobiae bacterium]|nr:DUF1501 domain-containing protein [Verrucomicrobiae bacterium]
MNSFLSPLESRSEGIAWQDFLNRRLFLRQGASALGTAALAGLLGSPSRSEAAASNGTGLPGFPNFPAKAKRIIYLFQSGAPSQMDLFDPKPQMEKQRGKDLP